MFSLWLQLFLKLHLFPQRFRIRLFEKSSFWSFEFFKPKIWYKWSFWQKTVFVDISTLVLVWIKLNFYSFSNSIQWKSHLRQMQFQANFHQLFALNFNEMWQAKVILFWRVKYVYFAGAYDKLKAKQLFSWTNMCKIYWEFPGFTENLDLK